MQGRLIFLVEEPSMKVLLDGLLPRFFPGWQKGTHFMCVPHEGKSDLDKSVPRKLKEWKVPGDRSAGDGCAPAIGRTQSLGKLQSIQHRSRSGCSGNGMAKRSLISGQLRLPEAQAAAEESLT